MRFNGIAVIIIAFMACIGCENPNKSETEGIWPESKLEHRPGVYWWWMGSAVDKENLTYNLENLNEAGIGGVTIVPIYGVKGEEHKFIDYLNPDWMSMLAHTVSEAKRLNMWVDMTTGTGWPFGGSHVNETYAAKKIESKIIPVRAGEQIVESINAEGWFLIKAYSDQKAMLDLTGLVGDGEKLVWKAPSGTWTVYILWQSGTGQKVKRAAPGNQGLVLDPFSVRSLQFYLTRFDEAFKDYSGLVPRAQYHDSFEYYNANWTDDFLQEFSDRRGYDLTDYLPYLFGNGPEDTAERVKADYRQTLAELHYDYIRKWVAWSHDLGSQTRDQAHGAPGNLLDLYAAADIPETETFGSSQFKIPGIRRIPENIAKDAPNPLVLQFSSSAAHVAGKKLVASETCTWLREHYKSALSQAKPEIDQLFLAGINHVFYHGNAYTPADAEWPGWLFYASTHFEKENAFWRDLPALNAYIRRVQSILQAGGPANDILLYWPVQDIWHNRDGMEQKLTVHNIEWLTEKPVGKMAGYLKLNGYTFDYISDKQLLTATFNNGKINVPGGSYMTVLIPECRFMPEKTWQNLLDLAEQGATIIFDTKMPFGVPGYLDSGNQEKHRKKTIEELPFDNSKDYEIYITKYGDGRLVLSSNKEKLLSSARVQPESVTATGTGFVRRQYHDGYYYFLANLSDRILDDWVPVNVSFNSVLILDPNTGNYGQARTRRSGTGSEVYIQLHPGASLILKTCSTDQKNAAPWPYYNETNQEMVIKSDWQIDFIDGGPELPDSYRTDNLVSWTEFPDKESKRFAGTACYTTHFQITDDSFDDWILDLGTVYESARIRINDREAGTLWSVPFRMPVGKFLIKGENKLEVEVTNLSANRIKDLDERQVDWKKFHEINFVNINYKPFDASGWPLMPSGLTGPVKLIAARYKNFQ